MITAHVVADSLAPHGARLTTIVATYPRFIHSELMTHRALSRNAASSRAIPVKKIINQVLRNPAMPVWWGKAQTGMQAREELSGWRSFLVKAIWVLASRLMVGCAWLLMKLNLHKQIANRILEPWFYMTTIISATEWDNMLALRCHPDAQPEYGVLAWQILSALNTSIPKRIGWGEWHLPFIMDDERKKYAITDLVKMSVARCARVSYQNHDGTNPNYDKDMQTYQKIAGSKPIHASPAEHQAEPGNVGHAYGNFIGWIQYRKLLPNENILVFDKLRRHE